MWTESFVAIIIPIFDGWSFFVVKTMLQSLSVTLMTLCCVLSRNLVCLFLRNCLTESMSGIHSVISSRCLYLITPLLYMFFLLHMFGCFGSCGTYPIFWRSVFCCLSCLVSNFTPMVGRLTCLRYFILWSSIHVSAFVRQGKPLDLFGGCFIDCFCILC